MGLLAPVAEFFFHEHRYRRISGDVLFVGRQTVFLNETSLLHMQARCGIRSELPGPVEYDEETVGARFEEKCITDRYFMRSIGVPKVSFLDVTDYEGADIVHDLGYPVPESLHNRFDFIYNGGCLDNMFNPGEAMMNLSRMLRPGGRVVCMESASSWNSPYLIYSPGWFFDYFATNNYADCKVYICSYHDNHELFYGPWETFYYDWSRAKNGDTPEAIHGNHLILLTIAEKGPDSTSDQQPVQYQYRKGSKLEAKSADIERLAQQYEQSPRPLLNSTRINREIPSDRLSRIKRRIKNRLGLTDLYGDLRYLHNSGTIDGSYSYRSGQ